MILYLLDKLIDINYHFSDNGILKDHKVFEYSIHIKHFCLYDTVFHINVGALDNSCIGNAYFIKDLSQQGLR